MAVSAIDPLSDDGGIVSYRTQLHIGSWTCGQATMHLTMHSDDGRPATTHLLLTESQRSQAQGAVVSSYMLAKVAGDGGVLEQMGLSRGEGRPLLRRQGSMAEMQPIQEGRHRSERGQNGLATVTAQRLERLSRKAQSSASLIRTALR
jgi:hypothetical protein